MLFGNFCKNFMWMVFWFNCLSVFMGILIGWIMLVYEFLCIMLIIVCLSMRICLRIMLVSMVLIGVCLWLLVIRNFIGVWMLCFLLVCVGWWCLCVILLVILVLIIEWMLRKVFRVGLSIFVWFIVRYWIVFWNWIVSGLCWFFIMLVLVILKMFVVWLKVLVRIWIVGWMWKSFCCCWCRKSGIWKFGLVLFEVMNWCCMCRIFVVIMMCWLSLLNGLSLM